ncbi:MAG: hypothetical protein L0338_33935 [Acidobacteria bacterium]|nr:hypothetical protein [Acidobacteriota bacterium]
MGVVRGRFGGRVKDQGDRPTCVAFAVSSLHEYWRDVTIGQSGAVTLDLSEEFLYYGCKQRDGLVAKSGTTIVAASEWLKDIGQCVEILHPYGSSDSSLRKPSAAAFSDAERRRVNAVVSRALRWDLLQRDLKGQVPVVGVIEVFESALRVEKSGLLSSPKSNERRLGLHAVLLLDVESIPQDNQVLFLNSWGAGWGDRGVGRFDAMYFAKHCKQLWTIERSAA